MKIFINFNKILGNTRNTLQFTRFTRSIYGDFMYFDLLQ